MSNEGNGFNDSVELCYFIRDAEDFFFLFFPPFSSLFFFPCV